VRGELGYNFDVYFPTERVSDANGIVKTDELRYVVGLDWYGFNETVISGQFFHSWITRHSEAAIRKQNDFTTTLLLQRDFLNDALIFQTIWIHDVRNGDGLYRAKLTYEIQTGLLGWIGIDWFYGGSNGVFGEFDSKDRAVVGFEYGF
jgi:hypothetical protein